MVVGFVTRAKVLDAYNVSAPGHFAIYAKHVTLMLVNASWLQWDEGVSLLNISEKVI